MELLHHCCTIPYGFTCALRYRSLVDWLDGHCVAQLARVMAADPPVFERLCLENDESVLATKEGSSYATSNLVIAFRLIRALVNRMDSMSESMREGDANFWARATGNPPPRRPLRSTRKPALPVAARVAGACSAPRMRSGVASGGPLRRRQ